MSTLRTLGKNILIKPAPKNKETTSAGGIVLPSGEKSGTLRAEVLAVGKDISEEMHGFKPGDVVLYERGAPVVDAGEGRFVVHADHIVAVLA